MTGGKRGSEEDGDGAGGHSPRFLVTGPQLPHFSVSRVCPQICSLAAAAPEERSEILAHVVSI